MDRIIPKHIAIILDGNGRWAKERGKIRIEGHKVGYKNIEPIALKCKDLGVEVLSVYCFSTENWNRPKMEVDFLMNVPVELALNVERYIKNNIKIVLSGRRDRMPKNTLDAFLKMIDRTKNCDGMILNVCFDYGALNDIKEAFIKMKADDVEIEEKTIYNYLSTKDLPLVDLLIRPGKEKRLSNYLLLECAYAELYFSDVYWPDFNENELLKAIDDYSSRNRKYGGIKEE